MAKPVNESKLLLFFPWSNLLLFFFSPLSYYISEMSSCFVFSSQDPHDELKGQNVLIVRGSAEETAAKFGLSMDVLGGLLNTALSTMREARQGRPRPHLDDKMLAAWNGEFWGSSQQRLRTTLMRQQQQQHRISLFRFFACSHSLT